MCCFSSVKCERVISFFFTSVKCEINCDLTVIYIIIISMVCYAALLLQFTIFVLSLTCDLSCCHKHGLTCVTAVHDIVLEVSFCHISERSVWRRTASIFSLWTLLLSWLTPTFSSRLSSKTGVGCSPSTQPSVCLCFQHVSGSCCYSQHPSSSPLVNMLYEDCVMCKSLLLFSVKWRNNSSVNVCFFCCSF